MDSPKTARKRKHDIFAFEYAGVEDDDDEAANGTGNTVNEDRDIDVGQSPTKKMKYIGSFEQVLKRKDGAGGLEQLSHERSGNGDGRKKRKV